MTFVFDKSELSVFATNLQEWYRKQLVYTIDRIRSSGKYEMLAPEDVRKIMAKFVEENPQPDWKTLL